MGGSLFTGFFNLGLATGVRTFLTVPATDMPTDLRHEALTPKAYALQCETYIPHPLTFLKRWLRSVRERAALRVSLPQV